ncbi:MAG: hypothetical protein ABWK53_04130 [Anaerolineales bacterium]
MDRPPVIRPLAVLWKGLLLFLILDLLVAALPPVDSGRLSLYNRLFPGRERLPFGENPAQAYNLSLFDLDAMFASHVIAAGPKPADEYRILLMGDSSVWGTLLRPEETLAGQLNAAALTLCGRPVRFYNLGYPSLSLTKDLLLLDYAVRYDPDLIIWLTTLEAFPLDGQLTAPIVAHNAARTQALIARYDLPFDLADPALAQPTFWERTLIGRRRALADWLRLQLYGILWAATGIDQAYPSDYPALQVDLEADLSFHDLQPPGLQETDLAFEVLEAGFRAAGDTPVLLVNEPMFLSRGVNSDLRYNFFYPRWAYDDYRRLLAERAGRLGWNYLDLWNLLPEAVHYTNSAIHLTPQAEAELARTLAQALSQMPCP